MKQLLTILICLAPCALVSTGRAQQSDSSLKTYRDTIFYRYMTNGAWTKPLHSKERADLVDSALKYLPQDAYLWQQRSMPLAKQGKHELSMVYLDSAVKYDSIHWIDYRAFQKCIFQKTYRAALEDFKVASRIHPGSHVMDHEYDYYRGLCFLMLSEYDSAEQCFVHCIQNDAAAFGMDYVEPSHAFYLGIVLYEVERYQDAVESFQRSLARYPQFADAKYYLALCQVKMKNEGTAVKLLREARNNLAEGHTIPDHNVMHERYPYQIKEAWVEGMLERLQTATNR
jgi:tetratricopeptide (TPR) repeat protein